MRWRNNISCRTVLYWMILSGTFLNYMLKIIPNVVIAGIVKRPPKLLFNIQCKKQMNESLIGTDDSIDPTRAYEFTWSEYEQGLMLSAYYWIHPFMDVFGGYLAKKYGTKIVFGIGILFTTILGYFLPLATKYHPYANIFVRVLQGIAGGLVFSSIHHLTATWIPQNERSKFVSSYMGQTIAIAVTYILSGYVMEYIGWESVFYMSSSLGILWFVSWWFLVYDSPNQHPRITKKEKEYILENIEKSAKTNHQDTSIPWKRIFTSVPLWATIISTWSFAWGCYTIIIQGPTYFSAIHGWNIKETGLLAGLPFILTYVFSFIFGKICDWLIEKKKMNRTNVRKLATFVCTGAIGLMVIGLAYSGCNSKLAFFFMFIGATLVGGAASGPWPNYVDLSPNYASIIFGISGLISASSGFLSPIIVGILTNKNQTIAQWQIIFSICAFIQWFGCIVYLIWGSGDEQIWNHQKFQNNDDSTTEEINVNAHSLMHDENSLGVKK